MHDLEACNSGSELDVLVYHFQMVWIKADKLVFVSRAYSIDLVLSIFGHKIGVQKSPALFQGKELQLQASWSCASDKAQ